MAIFRQSRSLVGRILGTYGPVSKRNTVQDNHHNLHDYETFRVVTKEIAGIINDRPIAYLDQGTIDPIIPSKLISRRILSRLEISDHAKNEDEIPINPESTPSKLLALDVEKHY